MPDKTFSYTGDWQKWDVPKKVEWVDVTLDGAGSGDSEGGRVSGKVNVKQVKTLWIQVGQKGQANNGNTGGAGTFGGGGAGGDGRGHPGGYSGGGASVIRTNSKTGAIKAVAGGAGGTSGDAGIGGRGGADVGEAGCPGVAGGGYIEGESGRCPNVAGGDTGNATGGTQIQGGNQGTSSLDSVYDGNSGKNEILARGGAGGGPGLPGTWGGGGGGGGYYPGGGGQAGLDDEHGGGGGGGGSNFRLGLTGYSSAQGVGALGNGKVSLSWVTPPPANQPPNAPSSVQIGGKDAVDEFVTQSTGHVHISAAIHDPDNKQKVRIVVQYAPNGDFANPQTVKSPLIPQKDPAHTPKNKKHHGRAEVDLNGLTQNTLYHVRIYAQDEKGLLSTNYNGVTFWTNRNPLEPTLITPGDNAQFSELSSAVFEWNHRDPDDPEHATQRSFELKYRRAGTPSHSASDWTSVTYQTYDETWVADPGAFLANNSYEWKVRTQDPQKAWGPFSETRSFFCTGAAAPPWPLSPAEDMAVVTEEPITFQWEFRDPQQGDTQHSADLRYRVIGAASWITLFGDVSYPGSDSRWTVPPETLVPGYHYEWQARTTDALDGDESQWSESARFWTITTPGSAVPDAVVPLYTTISGDLGCGTHRVFIYDRGGTIPRGEVTPIARIIYNRKRDDISNCIIDTSGFGDDCCALLSETRCWMHELVVFRDGVRVWEGPITRITYMRDAVEVEAKDVLAYLYRRIMRQGYNDAYRIINGEQVGVATVVERSRRIIMNALAPDDPNLLGYLTSFDFPDDARQSRAQPDFAKTAWEEIDDLAATAGLDYVAIGRRILLWDTHRPIGRLPEMRDENFNDPPVITEYGMLLATGFGVTNNAGIYGMADRGNLPYPLSPYGIVEQLASAYGETEGSGSEETLTSEAREKLEGTLEVQAERSIAKRWPTPLVVRVPDNSALTADTPVPFQSLVPGVWIPLRARSTCRELAQWQKLDEVTVEEVAGSSESVRVTMSPAPNAGDDPDAEALAVSEG